MWYIDIVRNPTWVDTFKINNDSVVELNYNDFTSKLARWVTEFNTSIAKAKWVLDWVKWFFWWDSKFETLKDKSWKQILSKEDKYLQNVALPKINWILSEYAEQWKIDDQKLKQQLSTISDEFIKLMDWKTPVDSAKWNVEWNPLADYFSWRSTKRKIDAAWL